MSWKASAWAKKVVHGSGEGQQVTRSEKLLLLVLADYHDEERNYAWPSVATLAEDTLMSGRNVQLLLRTLQAKGLIIIEAQRLEVGVSRPNRYHFPALTDRHTQVSPQGEIAASPLKSLLHPGVKQAFQGEGETGSSPWGEEPVSPKPSISHHLNRQGEPSRNNKASRSEIDETFLSEMTQRFPEIDIKWELTRFRTWWEEGPKKLKRPRTAFINWLTKAKQFRSEQNAQLAGDSLPSKYPRQATAEEHVAAVARMKERYFLHPEDH